MLSEDNLPFCLSPTLTVGILNDGTSIIPLEEFLDLVANGEVHHSLVVAAVAKYLLWKSEK